jgi:hypothetical protein
LTELRNRQRGRPSSLLAVSAVVILSLISGISMLFGIVAPSFQDTCLSPDEALICRAYGPPLVIFSFIGCGILGATSGWVGLRRPRVRAMLIGLGYLITVGGLMFGFFMTYTSPDRPLM